MQTGQGDMPRNDGYKLLVGKMRASGEIVYLHRIASTGDADVFRGAEAQGRSVAVGPDGDVWVAGLFAGALDFGAGPMVGGANHADEGFVVQFGPNGEHLRSLKIGAPVESIIRSSDGSITVVGHFLGNLRFGDISLDSPPTTNGIFVARLMP
jgi:hypothetical protein